jgi:hypothetical protein
VSHPPKKLLDQVRDAIRLKHYSIRTEETYVDWIRRFILFHSKRHPRQMGTPEIEAFLTHLAVDRKVAVFWSFFDESHRRRGRIYRPGRAAHDSGCGGGNLLQDAPQVPRAELGLAHTLRLALGRLA